MSLVSTQGLVQDVAKKAAHLPAVAALLWPNLVTAGGVTERLSLAAP